MRLSVIAVLGCATAGMFIVSMRGNYLFGYGMGQTPEKRELFAWANVAADVWKAFGLIVLTVLWRNRHRRMALIGGLAWFVCLLSGINSAIGVYVQDRTAATGSRAAHHATFKDAEKELEHLEARYARLSSARPVAQVEAAIAALLVTPIMIEERVRGTVGQRSADCTKPDLRTADACAKIGALREELALATQRETLELRRTVLRREIARMRGDGNADAPDPVGEFYAWVTRGLLSVRDVGFGFPLFFALLIEVVSAFGPLTLARYAELTRPPPTTSGFDRPDPAMAGYGRPRPAVLLQAAQTDGGVVDWMAARAVPATDTAAVSLETLHADYAGWCDAESSRALSINAFQDAFDRLREMPELAGRIRKFGTRYFGIALVMSSRRAQQA